MDIQLKDLNWLINLLFALFGILLKIMSAAQMPYPMLFYKVLWKACMEIFKVHQSQIVVIDLEFNKRLS